MVHAVQVDPEQLEHRQNKGIKLRQKRRAASEILILVFLRAAHTKFLVSDSSNFIFLNVILFLSALRSSTSIFCQNMYFWSADVL